MQAGIGYLPTLLWRLSAVSALMALLPFLVYLEDPAGCAGGRAGLHTGCEHSALWLDGGAVCGAVLSASMSVRFSAPTYPLSVWRQSCALRSQSIWQNCPLASRSGLAAGKLRKIIQESTGAAETYLAHQLPDQCGAMATPAGLLVLLFAFDWRLGLLSLVPGGPGLCLSCRAMTGKRMQEKMHRVSETPWRTCPTRRWSMSGASRWSRPSARPCSPSKSSRTPSTNYENWVIAYTKAAARAHDCSIRRPSTACLPS